jgi:hypothetical protein
VGFTSYGPDACGSMPTATRFESFLPGGSRVALSGTSMAGAAGGQPRRQSCSR